jgi:hypothetical protein
MTGELNLETLADYVQQQNSKMEQVLVKLVITLLL